MFNSIKTGNLGNDDVHAFWISDAIHPPVFVGPGPKKNLTVTAAANTCTLDHAGLVIREASGPPWPLKSSLLPWASPLKEMIVIMDIISCDCAWTYRQRASPTTCGHVVINCWQCFDLAKNWNSSLANIDSEYHQIIGGGGGGFQSNLSQIVVVLSIFLFQSQIVDCYWICQILIEQELVTLTLKVISYSTQDSGRSNNWFADILAKPHTNNCCTISI